MQHSPADDPQLKMYEPEIHLIRHGRATEAIARLLALMPLHHQDPALHTNLALAFEDTGDTHRAETGYLLILSRWPGHPEAAFNYGNFLARQKPNTHFAK